MHKILSFLLLLCCCVFGLEPSEVVVVYNADSAKSREAMHRYCAGRRIPMNNRMPLYGVARGDISREKFDANIKFPLLVMGRERRLVWPSGPQKLGTRIKAMVLMPDLPLRIQEDPTQAKKGGTGMDVNSAALDSELMLLGAEYPLASFGQNPYYGKPALPGKNERQVLLSVCRIDGPDEDCIKRMIDDPLEVERTGLWGWNVVDTGGPYKEGDSMMERVADICLQSRMPLYYERTKSTIVQDYPLMQDVACYCGWYTNPPDGPFRKASKTKFRFAQGAVAFHLHSFSATSLYDANTWVATLLQRGACVTAGNVAEPYLGPSLNCGLFFAHLYAGKTVGEAALLASPSVSWQCIVLGDPLYRPFPHTEIHPDESNPFVRWRMAVSRSKGDMAALKKTVDTEKNRKDGPLFAEIYAGLCSATGQEQEAERYYRFASDSYSPQRDKLRAEIQLAYTLKALERADDAAAVAKGMNTRHGTSMYAAAVQKIMKEFPAKAK